jgi:hypothetical protein
MMSDDITPEQAIAWREREKQRFIDGTYTTLPRRWLNSTWFQKEGRFTYDSVLGFYVRPLRFPDHFAHISIEKVAMIAFTENDKKGVADRQTRMAPGRYLNRFFSDVLTKEDIQRLATAMGSDYNDDAELKFAVTADEIEEVYVDGPHSCMQYPGTYFAARIHPCRVYAGYDLQLAYLTRNERITARALVWPENKVYGRVYGDHIRLEAKLKAAGYGEGGDGGLLSGARIARIMYKNNYVIPYLDHLDGAVDNGDHLVLVDGDHSGRRCCGADVQNGLSGCAFVCSSCDEEFEDNDDRRHTPDGESICESCYDDRYTTCGHTGYTIRQDEACEVRICPYRRNGVNDYTGWHTAQWGGSALDRYALYCEVDEVYYDGNSNVVVEVDGQTYGPGALHRDCVKCQETDEWVLKENSVTLADGRVVSRDYAEEHADGIRPLSPTVFDPRQTELPGIRIKPPAPHGYEVRHELHHGTCHVWSLYHNDRWVDAWQREENAVNAMQHRIERESVNYVQQAVPFDGTVLTRNT